MNKWTAGLVAGLIGSIVVMILMMAKGMMGLVPEFNAIAGNARIFAFLGTPETAMWGWVWHFVIGTVAWGLLYAAIRDFLPGGSELMRGLVFGIIAWLLMMVVWMPWAGHGIFALPEPGLMALVLALMVHVIYGLVVGWSFGKFGPSQGGGEQVTSGADA